MKSWGSPVQKTISSGAITIYPEEGGYYEIETQGGASTDDLDTISGGGVAGQLIFLKAYDGTHDVVVKHGTGNIYLDGSIDVTLDSETPKLALINHEGSTWTAIAPAQLILQDISARVYNSANISVADAAWQALTFNSERYDTNALHSTVSNTSRLTAPVDGKYLIWGNIRFEAVATGQRGIAIELGGTTTIARHTQIAASGTYPTIMQISTIYELSATNYVELEAYQDSGGAINVTASANFSPEFGMQLLART